MRSMAWLPAATLLSTRVVLAGVPVPSSVIRFASLDSSHPFQVSGTLYIPKANPMSRRPAVVLVHGTAGIGSVGAFHRQALLDAGLVVLEVDFKTGVYASRMDRPPFEYFLPMAFAALKALRAKPSVDPNRIGILGFSMGGGVALRTAVEAERCAWMGQDRGFAAIVAFYPVCKSFIPTAERVGALTGAPILVAYGTRDAYGEKAAVPELKRVLRERFHFDLETLALPGAPHAFDRQGPPLHYPAPMADGGEGYTAWNPHAAQAARARMVAFFRKQLTDPERQGN